MSCERDACSCRMPSSAGGFAVMKWQMIRFSKKVLNKQSHSRNILSAYENGRIYRKPTPI